MFRTDTPGRDCASIRTLNKRHRVGQAGLVSALAANPWHRNLLAAGCYDRSVGLYDFTTREQLLLLRGHAGGVTCVRFSPDGNFLYTGARKDDQVLCWDVRGASEGARAGGGGRGGAGRAFLRPPVAEVCSGSLDS